VADESTNSATSTASFSYAVIEALHPDRLV